VPGGWYVVSRWVKVQENGGGVREMEKYYPVTKDELDQIKNDCYYPTVLSCDGCDFEDEQIGCNWKGANILEDEILTRVDPLDLLEAWDSYNNSHFGMPHPTFFDMIRLVREKPADVIAHGKEQGWLK
jgi:hypothetical protein